MLKTISAALLAVSVLAAPALAAGTGKTVQAPVIKSEQVKQKSALNAHAKPGRHHVRHATHRRVHKEIVTRKAHPSSKISAKHVTHSVKRG
jgi:hypothetical protein